MVAYRAPRVTYAPDSPPRDRLFALLQQLSSERSEPSELIAAAPGTDLGAPAGRLLEGARSLHRVGPGRPPSPRVQDMLAQVREPLLSVLRISPDFRPAYDPLLAMATALARSDVAGARTLLTELTQIQPARAEAPRVLASIVDPVGH